MTKSAAMSKLATAVTEYINAEQDYSEIVNLSNEVQLEKSAQLLQRLGLVAPPPPPPQPMISNTTALLGLLGALGLGGAAAYGYANRKSPVQISDDITSWIDQAQSKIDQNLNPLKFMKDVLSTAKSGYTSLRAGLEPHINFIHNLYTNLTTMTPYKRAIRVLKKIQENPNLYPPGMAEEFIRRYSHILNRKDQS